MGSSGRGESRRKDAHPEGSSVLSDWAGIQAHVAEEDEERIRGYSEDIDAMLLFAGLFSAILTAFLVEVYQQLLPSTGEMLNHLLAQNNELLAANHRLLNQGFSAMLTQASFSPSPAVLAERPPLFTSSTTARVINALFFVSLVLSLAAALFGILVKQWYRHYMTWHSALSSPRENVLVRQFRFEAWQVWDVAIVVSMALALLETAMTLFLIGIILLLWTLDSVVAICVTVATSLFLIVQCIFTLLPVMFRRCPYRTPTAWSAVLLFTLITRGPSYCVQGARVRYESLCKRRNRSKHGVSTGSVIKELSRVDHAMKLEVSPTSPSAAPSIIEKAQTDRPDGSKALLRGMSWRTRDIQSCKTMHRGIHQRLDLTSQVLNTTTRIAERIIREFVPLPKDISDFKEMTDLLSELVATYGDQSNSSFLEELGEMGFLLGALFWVQKSAQDMQTNRYIEQCSRVELRDSQGSLKWFLKAFSSTGPYAKVSTATVDKLRLFLLQFVLCGIGFPVTSGVQFEAYDEALQTRRVSFSAEDDRLVISKGETQDGDYESLLVNYFGSRFEHANEDRLKMFVLTATRWLSGYGIPGASQETVEDILDKMIRAAKALARGPRQNTTRPSFLYWIWELAGEKEQLSSLYSAQYCTLLHALEKAYVGGMFSADERNIKHSLHVQLRAAHHALATPCPTLRCQWAAHTSCPGEPRNHYRGCPLLKQHRRSRALWRRAKAVITVLRMRRAWFHGHLRWRQAILAVLFVVRVQRTASSPEAVARRATTSGSSTRSHGHHLRPHLHHSSSTGGTQDRESKDSNPGTVLPLYRHS
ncbi:hypothetical protein PsYK624_118560 [Phanerochaete sordida]|uniref:DUF6535 domain-containing protein n=1 Tax=Phanerochaete sordida TaxID=48140 RepID=A0A9P3GLF6_9APHY|nr:hypothetical protein PsYK624_118560 [Phanerochaete sordida]